MDKSQHLCLICNQTVEGLLQYVEHYKSHSNGAVKNPVATESPSDASAIIVDNVCVKEEKEIEHCTELDSISDLHVQFSDPNIEAEATLEPYYQSSDFFQSLKLKSIAEETPPKAKLKAVQRLSILEDDAQAEILLPITTILGNLDFSSSDDEFGGAEDEEDAQDREKWFEKDSDDFQSHPPQGHTGGKWKPGQAPKRRMPVLGRRTIGSVSRKSILRKSAKVKDTEFDSTKSFYCSICNSCFEHHSEYLVHFRQVHHEENAAKKKRDETEVVDFEIIETGETDVAHTSNESDVPVQNSGALQNGVEVQSAVEVQDSVVAVQDAFSERKKLSKGDAKIYCDVCDLYFETLLVLASHSETKAHKEAVLKQGSQDEILPKENIVNRCDAQAVTDVADQTENLHPTLNTSKPPEAEQCKSNDKQTGPLHDSPISECDAHNCPICDKLFARKYDMARHLMTRFHATRAKYHPQAASQGMLEKYNKYMVRLMPYQCAICSFYFNNQKDFLDHMCSSDHINTCKGMLGPLLCVACKVKTHDPKEIIEKKPCTFKCPMCEKCLLSKRKLQVHFSNVHKQKSPFYCKICDRRFNDQRLLDDHKRTRLHAKRLISLRKRHDITKKNTKPHHQSKHRKDPGGEEDLPSHAEIQTEENKLNSEERNKRLDMTNDNTARGDVEDPQDNYKVEGVEHRLRSSRKRKPSSKFSRNEYEISSLAKKSSACTLSTKKSLNESPINQKPLMVIKEGEADKDIISTTGDPNDVIGVMDMSDDVNDDSFYLDDDDGRLLEASKTVFSCTCCEFAAPDFTELKTHYSSKHPDEIITCEQCNQYFLSLKAYRIHCSGRTHQLRLRELTSDATIHKCRLCDMRFLQEYSCRLHLETNHRHPSCEAELKRLNKGQDMVTQLYGDHIKQVENLSKDSSISCPECGRFVKKDTLVEHLRLHTGEKPFECRFCETGFTSASSLRRHLPIHLNMSLFVCDMCGKEFKTQERFMKHLHVHDSKKNGHSFKCKVCKALFYTPKDLERHNRRHGDRNFPCTWPGCQWSFFGQNELKTHMLIHTCDKKFLCELCGFSAATKSRLTTHEKTHNATRTYTCEYCPYKTNQTSHLRRHMRIHNNAKPFSCPYCQYKCNTQANMRKHILGTNKHVGKKLYPCNLCNKFSTNNGQDFRGHMITAHADYLKTNAVDSLSVFFGFYKEEEDLLKPKEGSEIIQVTKGRHYKIYGNTDDRPPPSSTKTNKKQKVDNSTVEHIDSQSNAISQSDNNIDENCSKKKKDKKQVKRSNPQKLPIENIETQVSQLQELVLQNLRKDQNNQVNSTDPGSVRSEPTKSSTFNTNGIPIIHVKSNPENECVQSCDIPPDKCECPQHTRNTQSLRQPQILNTSPVIQSSPAIVENDHHYSIQQLIQSSPAIVENDHHYSIQPHIQSSPAIVENDHHYSIQQHNQNVNRLLIPQHPNLRQMLENQPHHH